MYNDTFQANSREVIEADQPVELSLLVDKLRNSIWNLGIPSWLFGITDRTVASLADGYFSAIELSHLFIASFFFVSWLYLKPEVSLSSVDRGTVQIYKPGLNPSPHEVYLYTAQARMFELQDQHMISQAYILPFPYLCQIYHLLNLKHLEKVHSFSLNNLKVIKVSYFQPTAIGGVVRFQTALGSPVNALRIWRQPIVEAGLILHTPYTVELRIPVYNDKYIIVIFNVLPLSSNEHKLFIDIYSNLNWPRPLLQILLHFASCLTLFEDLPYLKKLAERNLDRLLKSGGSSNHQMMWLFKRFVDLYSSSLEPAPAVSSLKEDVDNPALAPGT